MSRCLVVLLLLLLPIAAGATGLTGARWNGDDLLLSFSDSVRWEIDLAATDSNQLVVRFASVDSSAVQGEIAGPGGLKAIVTTARGVGTRLTLLGTGRLGYSLLWKPYTNRLQLHTFDWSKLSYGEDQYHRGLIALEQQLNGPAEELLKVAESTGEARARTALGLFYASNGNDTAAMRYLDPPTDPDAATALATIQRRRGDTRGAELNEGRAKQLASDEARPVRQSRRDGARAGDSRSSSGSSTPSSKDSNMTLSSDWILLLSIGGGLLLLLILIIWLARRSGKEADAQRIVERRETREATTAQAPPPVAETVQPAPVVEPRPAETQVAETKPLEPIATEPVAVQPVAVETPKPVVTPPVDGGVTSVEEIPARTEIDAARERRLAMEAEIERRVAAARAALATESVQPPVAPEAPAEPAPVQAEEPARPIEASAPVGQSMEAPALEHLSEQTTANAGDEAQLAAAAREEMMKRRRVPSQAAELRQRIESMRRDMPTPNESTVTAARRLNISRDNVDLRRKIEAKKGEE